MIPQMKRRYSDGITMILLVVPRGFSTGTELLKTSAHNSQTDFPMVNLDPPVSERERRTPNKVRVMVCRWLHENVGTKN